MANDYTLSAKITGDASGFEKAIGKAQSQLSKIASKFESFGAGCTKVGKALAPVTAGMTALTGVSVKTSMSFVKLYESTIIVFEKMLGGKDAANELYASLLDIAKATTFSQETFLKMSKSLIGVGVSAEDTKKLMKAAADGVSAFGGTSADLERVGYAFRKMATAGKLSMQELDMINDAGINGLKILANQYGVTTDEMRKMISKGAVPAEEAMRKLADGIENGTDGVNGMTEALAGMSEKMKGKTLTGALDSMRSAVRNFALAFVGMNPTLKEGSAGFKENQQRIAQLTASIVTINQIIPLLTKVFAGVTDGIGKFLDKLIGANVAFNEATGEWENAEGVLGRIKTALENVNPDKIKIVGDVLFGLGAAGAGLLIVGKAMNLFSVAAGTASKAVSGLSMVMNPVALIAIALGGAFLYLFKTNEQFRNGVINTASSIASTVKPAISGIMDVLSGLASSIVPILQGLGAAIAPVFTNIFNVIVGVFNGLNPIFTALKDAFKTVFDSISGSASSFGSTLFMVLGRMFPMVGLVVNLFKYFGDDIVNIFSTIGNNVAPIIDALAQIIGGVLSTAIQTVIQVVAALEPAFAILIDVGKQLFGVFSGIVQDVMPVIANVFQSLTPLILQVVDVIGRLISSMAPLVTQLVAGLAPVISTLATLIGSVVKIVAGMIQSIMPAVIAIIQVVISIIQAILPILEVIIQVIISIVTIVINVISQIIAVVAPIITFIIGIIANIISAISPIITFVANVISTIISVITPIIEFVAGVIGVIIAKITSISTTVTMITSAIARVVMTVVATITSVVSKLVGIFGTIFNNIFNIVRGVFQSISSVIGATFRAIRSAWSGLTGFVSGVVSGIGSAFSSLTSRVKSAVNAVIGGVNGAIGIINKIPGVSISRISYLYRGTDNWQGGFAAMNEGGRGEITYLPSGTQVIPHDISMKYAKEAARNQNTNVSGEVIRSAVVDGMMSFVGVIENGMSEIAGRPIILDSGALVGGVIGDIDVSLQSRNSDRERRAL